MTWVSEMRHLARRAVASLRTRGLRTTAEAVIATLGSYWFDVRYGTNTAGVVRLAALQIISPNRSRGVAYSPTNPQVFARLIRQVDGTHPGVFIDLGCGKGRVLLLAANHGFDRVVGVEFSPELCRTARSNIAAYLRRTGSAIRFEVIEADVTDYRMVDDESVLFLYNPFDAIVMNAVLDEIQNSYRRHPRTMWLIYYNPVYRDVVERRREFQLTGVVNYAGGEGRVYSIPAPALRQP